MSEIIEKIRREPVLVTTLVGSVLVALVAFNVPLTEQQVTALVAVAAAIMAIVARQQVTPVHDPSLPAGSIVRVQGTDQVTEVGR